MQAHRNHQQRAQDNLQRALSSLVGRIEAGEEFPDACGRVASAFNVPYEYLRDAYDEQDRSRNAEARHHD